MDGLLFIFVHRTYHIFSALRKKMQKAKLIDTYTVRGLLIEMGTLTQLHGPECKIGLILSLSKSCN